MSVRSAFIGALGALATLVVTGGAQAYCNTTNCRDNACLAPFAGDVCEHDEHPLQWPEPTIAYTFARRPDGKLSGMMSDEEARSMTAQALLSWSEVQCPSGPTPVRFVERAELSDQRSSNYADGDNVIAFLSEEEWETYPCAADPEQICPLAPEAFAFTDVFFSSSTGVIRAADMMINGGQGPFGECPEPDGCEPGTLTDLRNIITHEAGHVLGLSHSEDPDATMFASALPWQVDKRSLESDDVAGMCDLYEGSGRSNPLTEAQSGGCSAAGGAPNARSLLGWAPLALLGLVIASRRRRLTAVRRRRA